ncbi:MAG: MFS transporter [Chlamydiota bacterium]
MPSASPSHPKISFLILCSTAFIVWISYGIVYPLFAAAIFQKEALFFSLFTSMQGFWLGVLISASPLAQFFSAPLIGLLSDRMGRKPMLQITTAMIMAGYFISALGFGKQSFFLLILGRVVTGIGAGNIAVINSAVADLSAPTAKAKNFGLIAMTNGLGFAVGPLIGGKLAFLGFDFPFIIAGIFTLINLIFIIFLLDETHLKKTGSTHTSLRLYQHVKVTFFQKNRHFFLAFFLFCFGWSFYWEFIPVTWIREYSLGVSQIGDFYAYGSLFYVLSSGLLIRPVIKRLSAFKILFFAWAALGIFLLLLVGAWIGLYWIFIPIQQFLIALIFPVGTAVVSNLVSEHQQGETLGAFQSLQAFAFAVTPCLGGILLDFMHNTPLIVSALAMLLSSWIFYRGHKSRPRTSP